MEVLFLKDKPLRVLQILGVVAGGGVESVILNYYKHIDRNKVQFDFVVHEDSPIDITVLVNSMGGKVFKVTSYKKNILAFTSEIYHIIKSNKYQIVHSNMNTLSFFSLFASWIAGTPIRILHNHSTSVPSETKRNLLKMILRPFSKFFANRYFACSELAGRWMYGDAAFDNHQVTIINNAIEFWKYKYDVTKRQQLRQKLNIADTDFVVGNVGRMVYQKNPLYLIEVFAQLQQKVPNSKLLLIGDGSLRNQMHSLIEEKKITDKVIDLGLRTDVDELYNVMDAFCFPTRYEGLGMVIVEAQANGLPIVMSPAVPQEAVLISDLVAEESIKPDNVKHWVADLKKIQNGEKFDREKCNFVFSNSIYDIDLAADRLASIYRKIVSEI
jgi:glycosyltransferase involved in cell wall biosynthesis